jgi:hypothetical protein
VRAAAATIKAREVWVIFSGLGLGLGFAGFLFERCRR